MKVYKVVRRITRYPVEQEGPRWSIMAHPSLGGVAYERGKKTVPRPEYGPLAAFQTFEDALYFCGSSWRYWEIWEAEAEPSDCDREFMASYLEDVKKYWELDKEGKLLNHTRLSRIPPGTVWCESITPTEMVDSRENHLDKEVMGVPK